VELIYTERFDTNYRALEPGGVCACVVRSFAPNPFKKQHATATLESSAASLSFSDMPSKVSIKAKQSFSVGLLENSSNAERLWTKIVLSISN
jgi:hypothetical protein